MIKNYKIYKSNLNKKETNFVTSNRKIYNSNKSINLIKSILNINNNQSINYHNKSKPSNNPTQKPFKPLQPKPPKNNKPSNTTNLNTPL
jgi:hypothetical protein